MSACSLEAPAPGATRAASMPDLSGLGSADGDVVPDLPDTFDPEVFEERTAVIDFEDPAAYTLAAPAAIVSGSASLESFTRSPADEAATALASAGIYPLDPPDATPLDAATLGIAALWHLDEALFDGTADQLVDATGLYPGRGIAFARNAKWGGGAQVDVHTGLAFPEAALPSTAPQALSLWVQQDLTGAHTGWLAGKRPVDATFDVSPSRLSTFDVVDFGRSGYLGGAFDGRYVYLAPHRDGNGYHGNIARYDTTQPDMTSAGAWDYFDTVGSVTTRGFAGSIFDGRYVYFVPSATDSGPHGKLTRYDTRADFKLGSSYSQYDVSSFFPAAKGFAGAAFDGRWLYLAPAGDPPHGQMVRYDTTRGLNFSTSWQGFDVASRLDVRAKGFAGAVFDGRYVYYAPAGGPATAHGNVVRFDTRGAFADPASWRRFDTEVLGAGIKGFGGTLFDGHYVYFMPSHDGDAQHGNWVRYDTRRAFDGPASWQVNDLGSLNYVGFADGAFDGRYLYLVNQNDSLSGFMWRYDTLAPFEPASVASAYVGGAANGFYSAVFDGRFLYYVPYHDGTAPQSVVLRYDTLGEALPLSLWSSLGSQGGFSGGPIGPLAAVETDAGRFTVAHPARLTDDSWHHLVVGFDGAELSLEVDERPADAVATTGTWLQSSEPLLVGAWGFAGLLDELAVWSELPADDDAQTRGGRAADSSAAPANGDLWNRVTPSAGFEPGAFGGGVELDPAGHVVVPPDPRLQGALGVTVQTWVRRQADRVPAQVEWLVARWGAHQPLRPGDFDAVDPGALITGVGGGYAGGAFDGRYVYLAPARDSSGPHGHLLRFDAFADLDEALSWSARDVGAGGFEGAAFDGRYVYLVPDGRSADATRVVRYDTQALFAEPDSYASLDLTDLGGRVGARGAAFDGRFLYLVPGADLTGPHGNIVRYDTQRPFDDASAWSSYDAGATSGLDVAGAAGAVFDGRFLYFVPGANAAGPHGGVLRYDTTAPFQVGASWTARDVASLSDPDNGSPPPAVGFCGGAFDGRYLYLAPAPNGTAEADTIVRFDTRGAFDADQSWARYDLGELDGAATGGFQGAFFDGTFVTFVPYHDGDGNASGRVVRYDTRRALRDPLAWNASDQGTTRGLTTRGMRGAVFDGRHLYFVPNFDGSSYHARVLRLDVTQGDAFFALGASLGAQGGGLSGGPVGPFAAADTAVGYRIVFATEPLDDQWHELTMTSGSVDTVLFVDGLEAASTRNFGQLEQQSGWLRIGEGFAGELDDVAIWPAVIDRAAILRHVLDGYPVGRAGAVELATSLELTGVVAWSGFSAVETLAPGAQLRYQVSTDGGATWRVWDGFGWQGETSLSLGSSAEDVDANIAALPTAQGRINVRVILETDDGAVAPSIDQLAVRYLVRRP